MIKLDLQKFGGGSAGGSLSNGGSLGGGGGKNVDIVNQTDVWTYRHRKDNEAFVDDINSAVRQANDDFPGLTSDTITEINSTEFGGLDRVMTLGCYGQGQLDINRNYTNVDKMNSMYDADGGHHPGRGNKSAVEAVTYHELGHAITDHIGKKNGLGDIDKTSNKIVKDAYKASGAKGGNKAWAGKISGYAQKNYAECVAEAVCDWYCNGNKASTTSKAIMAELRKYK